MYAAPFLQIVQLVTLYWPSCIKQENDMIKLWKKSPEGEAKYQKESDWMSDWFLSCSLHKSIFADDQWCPKLYVPERIQYLWGNHMVLNVIFIGCFYLLFLGNFWLIFWTIVGGIGIWLTKVIKLALIIENCNKEYLAVTMS